jgi:hypothetical protein
VEVVPPAPAAEYAWINGTWWWNGDEYVWMRGYWAPRPMTGYVWVGTGWTYESGRYRFMPGHWVASPARVRERYVHPVPRVRVQTGTTYRVTPNVPSVRVPVRPR